MKCSILTAIILLSLGLLIAGCAHEPSLFQEGTRDLAEGRIEQGLSKLEQASNQEPQNPEYRAELFRQRELALAQLLSQAEAARANNDADGADAIYQRVLKIDPGNERAQAGVAAVATGRRHRVVIAEAEALFKKGDYRGAEQSIAGVLAQNPNQREARLLQRRIDEVRRRDELAAKTLKPNLKRPISLDFRDANIRAIFEAIARSSGINYVFDRDVRPDLRTTIQLKNKNIDDAVKILLVTNQLEQKVVDEDTVIIYPNVPAKQIEYQDLTVKAFYLANADAKQVLNTIRSVIKTRDIIFDEKLNMLVMRDTPEAVRVAEKLVALEDQADPEVMLQVEVLEVSTTRMQDLGIRFPQQVSFSVVGAANTPGTITLPEFQNRNSSLVQIHVGDPALTFNIMRTDTDTKVIANPQVRVRNREKARIQVGERVPVVTTVSTPNVGVTESVNYLDVGLRLEIQPNIYLEDEVAMNVGLEVSNIVNTLTTASGNLVYTLGTRNAATTLRLKDGETQILGGLIQNDERSTVNKVPGLSDLPIIGELFSDHNKNNAKTEIVLLITPHIIRNIVRPPVDIAEFPSGIDINRSGPSNLSLTEQQIQEEEFDAPRK